MVSIMGQLLIVTFFFLPYFSHRNLQVTLEDHVEVTTFLVGLVVVVECGDNNDCHNRSMGANFFFFFSLSLSSSSCSRMDSTLAAQETETEVVSVRG